MKARLLLSLLLLSLTACGNPQPGPDKSLGGAVLGAAWGAGAGAVVGNQVSSQGGGIAVGAGFGAASGLITGAGMDMNESAMMREEKELASLKVQNMANTQELANLQASLDRAYSKAGSGIYQVFFDPDATNLRLGSISNLEKIADSIKANPGAFRVHVDGHTDDSGRIDYNNTLAEARARSVASYLAARGIGVDQISVNSFGSKRPIASNSNPTGRQLNRRVDVYVDRY